MNTSSYYIDPQLKQKAEAIIKMRGSSPSIFLAKIYSYIVETEELPLEKEKIPNALTKKTIKNSRKGINIVKCKDETDFLKKLKA